MSGDETEWIAERTVSLGAAGFAQDSSQLQAAVAHVEDDLTGKILADKFELTAFLGSGGMSEVYKARHIVTGKVVAVKILHQKLAKDEVTSKRLKQEAQAAGALKHSSILSVHDFGVDSAGTPFLVMDFLDGVSLSDILKKEGPLPLDRFLTIMQQVASALAHAQQQNVVHRDLKPSNIMILKEGKDRAMIVDFGIAKLVDPNNEASQRLTQTGELFGSPLYMSPEQCTGAPVDPRSDVYAMGCVMFEALTGNTPYMGETVFDTIHRHINASPPPLLAPHLEASVRDRMEGIILKCLAKSPTDRYQSAASIEAELRKIELSEASGLVSRIGSAFSLAQAKYLAKRKTNVPLLVISLFSVSALSVVASIVLLFSLIDFNESNERLINKNSIINEYGMATTQLAWMYRESELFLMDRKGSHLRAYKRYNDGTKQTFRRIARLLRGDKEKLAGFNKRKELFEEAMDDVYQELKSMPASQGGISTDFSELMGKMTSFAKLAQKVEKEQVLLFDLQKDESKDLKVEKDRVRTCQQRVLIAGLFAILLNSSVLITMIVYFVRKTPKRIKSLVDSATRPPGSAQLAPTKEDEGVGVENLLQELAGALSEAEQREQALLAKLQKQAVEESVSSTNAKISDADQN